MNPKIKITVDAKNKAIAAFDGMATVGAKIDVEIVGLPSGIENWGTNDDFRNDSKSLRFRIVDELGHDLVRFPNVKKTSASATDGDQWQVVPAAGTTPETYKTYNGTTSAQVDFDTDKLREAFRGVAFNDKLEFGIIIDSYVDKAEFAVGKMKIQQWATASTEDPTVLPDWRETLDKLKTDLAEIEASKTAAETAATNAATSAQSAGASASSASGSASAASGSASSASVSASAAEEQKQLAQAAKNSAEAAKISAEVAASHYPTIGANENWYVWNAAQGEYVDTGHSSNGGHNIFKGKVFSRPVNAKGWYELLAYLVTEMGGNISMDGIVPGTAPTQITMTAVDGASKSIKVVKSNNEYTTEVV